MSAEWGEGFHRDGSVRGDHQPEAHAASSWLSHQLRPFRKKGRRLNRSRNGKRLNDILKLKKKTSAVFGLNSKKKITKHRICI